MSLLGGWWLAFLFWGLAVMIFCWRLGIRLRLPVYIKRSSSQVAPKEEGT